MMFDVFLFKSVCILLHVCLYDSDALLLCFVKLLRYLLDSRSLKAKGNSWIIALPNS